MYVRRMWPPGQVWLGSLLAARLLTHYSPGSRLLFKPHRSLPADSTMGPLHNDNCAAYDFLTLVPARIKRRPVDKCLYTHTLGVREVRGDPFCARPVAVTMTMTGNVYVTSPWPLPSLHAFPMPMPMPIPIQSLFLPLLPPVCGSKFPGIPETHPSICLISISAAIPQWHFT